MPIGYGFRPCTHAMRSRFHAVCLTLLWIGLAVLGVLVYFMYIEIRGLRTAVDNYKPVEHYHIRKGGGADEHRLDKSQQDRGR